MGIKGLNWFIHNYPIRLLENIDVSNVTVVIDGSELLYHLYFLSGNQDFRCGGEYTAFRSTICQFIEVLRRCAITPYVVFDSFKSENNIQRYLQERTAKLAGVRELVDTGTSKKSAKPLFGNKVLRQTLSELDVPFIVVPGDADAEIAEIANQLDAMVLACDTDFCIFRVKKGFLLLDDLKWQEVKSFERSCRAKIFHQSIFQETFGTPTNALCILEPLMSKQDGIIGFKFDDFLKRLPREVRIPRDLPRNFRRPNWIECALVWLRTFRSNDQVIQAIRTKVPNLHEDRFKECLRVYQQPPNVGSYVDKLLDEERPAEPKPYYFETVDGMAEPVIFLPLMVDNPAATSSQLASSSIRQVIYELGYTIKLADEENENKEHRIVEMDRIGQNYGARVIKVEVPNNDETEKLHLLMTKEEIQESDERQEIMKAREEYIYRTLLSVGEFPDDMVFGEENKLLIATCHFWARRQEERPQDEICKALALTFSYSYYEVSDGVMPDDFTRIPDDSFDKEALHFSAQWQAIVSDTMRLNDHLDRPIPNPQIGRLFSGKLFQKSYAFFLENGDLTNDDAAELLFNDEEAPKQFFLNIIEIMLE